MLKRMFNRGATNKVAPVQPNGPPADAKKKDKPPLNTRIANAMRSLYNQNSKLFLAWSMVLFFISFYNCFLIPFRIVFLFPSVWWLIPDVIFDIVLILDMILLFFKPYKQGAVWILKYKQTSRRYLRTWFLPDFIARFPCYAFAAIVGADVTDTRLRVNYVLLFLRVLGQFTVFEKFMRIAYVSLVRLLYTLLMVAHFLACGMVAIALAEGSSTSNNWVNSQTFFLPITSVYYRYGVGIYWVLTTMTGFGGTQPTTDYEVYMNMLTTVIGMAYYALAISIAGDLISNRDPNETSFNERFDEIKDFMTMRRIPLDLSSRVINYYEYLWRSRRGLDENSVLEDLPDFLRGEVAMYLNREIIAKVPIFKDSSKNFLTEVVMHLIPRIALPDSHIIRIGELGHEMFFISSGTVAIKTAEGLTVATLRDGNFFGEIALLKGTMRTADVVATSYCDLFVMTKDDFDELLSYHPNEAEALVRIGDARHQELTKSKDTSNSDSSNQLKPSESTYQLKSPASSLLLKTTTSPR